MASAKRTNQPGKLSIQGKGSVASSGDMRDNIIITGDYTQTVEGSLDIAISGNSPDSGFDQLIVSSNVTLAGTLNVTFANGFEPSRGYTWFFRTASYS